MPPRAGLITVSITLFLVTRTPLAWVVNPEHYVGGLVAPVKVAPVVMAPWVLAPVKFA